MISKLALVGSLLAGYVLATSGNELVELSSGAQRVSMIELYTSEGCSSCPPADRWFSKLEESPDLWKTFVLIAFHVDYWDQIGWVDRFAKAEYSDRQRKYAAEGGARVVYTPGMFRNGKEWLGWRSGDLPGNGDERVGALNVKIKRLRVDARFDALDTHSEALLLHVARLGMNLETEVRAGENRGRTLHHDFVVLDIVSVSLEKDDSGFTASLQLPDIEHNLGEQTMVAWISSVDKQTPIQAVGGYLPDR